MLQTQKRLSWWTTLLALPLVLSLFAPLAAPAFAAEAGWAMVLTVDAPTNGVTLTNGRTVMIGGWAVDAAARGTGVDRVSVYLDGQPGSGVHIGDANFGIRRPDVAATYGPELTNSGFQLDWTPRGISEGDHTLYVVAQSTSSGQMVQPVPVVVDRGTNGNGGGSRSAEGGYGSVTPLGLGGFGYGGSYPYFYHPYPYGHGGSTHLYGYGGYGGFGGFGGGFGRGFFGGGYGGRGGFAAGSAAAFAGGGGFGTGSRFGFSGRGGSAALR